MSEISLAPDAAESLPTLSQPTGLLRWIASVDHKQIGIMYIIAALIFFVVGGIEAMALRMQLARPENNLISPELYNQLFTLHGTTMVFLVGMPILIGFGNYLVPLQIGAHDMAFPRLNALGLWLLIFGGLLMYYSFFIGSAPDQGWFSYTPLAEQPYTSHPGPDYWALGDGRDQLHRHGDHDARAGHADAPPAAVHLDDLYQRLSDPAGGADPQRRPDHARSRSAARRPFLRAARLARALAACVLVVRPS
jgi:hypothetical protein